MRFFNIYLLLGLTFITSFVSAQTITLNSQNYHVVVKKASTVTFKYHNDIHVGNAREEGLHNISGLTFSAGIIYDIAFENGFLISRGKIFNYTDNHITIICSFFNNNHQIVDYAIDVKPRTFSRMIPDNESIPHSCNKVVCYEKGISIGYISNNPTKETNICYGNNIKSGSSISRYFSTKTVFYAEISTIRQTVTYYPNGTCSCIGYVLNNDYWVKGTSQGKYYIQNSTIHVTWDDWLKEEYRLINNSYTNDELYFKRK